MNFKVVAVNGSPHPKGNTFHALKLCTERLEKVGIEVEHVQLGGMLLHGCQACGACFKLQNRRCAFNDGLNEILEKVWEADGLLIGSPTYYSGMTSETKAFIDRCGYVAKANGRLLNGKIGAPVVVHRRAGANMVYAGINYLFGITGMPIATSCYWNMGVALQQGDLANDEESVGIFETLGDNMAQMIQKLRGKQ